MIINYLNNDVSLDYVCVIFDCPKQSLYRWIKIYEEIKKSFKKTKK